MSGYTADIIDKKGILAENLNFLPKPISPLELLQWFVSWTDNAANATNLLTINSVRLIMPKLGTGSELCMENLELLQKSQLFKGSSSEELEVALGLIQERKSRRILQYSRKKCRPNRFISSKTGSVRISVMAGEGEEKTLLQLGTGDFFGELALLQEESRMVSARAESPVELLVLTRKDFQALIELDHGQRPGYLRPSPNCLPCGSKPITRCFGTCSSDDPCRDRYRNQ